MGQSDVGFRLIFCCEPCELVIAASLHEVAVAYGSIRRLVLGRLRPLTSSRHGEEVTYFSELGLSFFQAPQARLMLLPSARGCTQSAAQVLDLFQVSKRKRNVGQGRSQSVARLPSFSLQTMRIHSDPWF